MKRYQLYTILALVLMTVGFTIPVIAYHGVANKIKNGAEIPSYVYPIYNLYTKIQYKSHNKILHILPIVLLKVYNRA